MKPLLVCEKGHEFFASPVELYENGLVNPRRVLGMICKKCGEVRHAKI